MVSTLDVYLHRECVGQLTQNTDGEMSFAYATDWLSRPDAVALSQSLPLRPDRYNRRASRPFFGGLLPEQEVRKTIAKNLGISSQNDFSILTKIGGECAGAVTFLPASSGLPEAEPGYRRLDLTDLAEILEELPRRPLLAGEQGIRLSLAGAQPKLAVCLEGDVVSIPLGGAPSTHILKRAVFPFVNIVANELFCMNLAKYLGLKVANVQKITVEQIDYLLVERYDRAVIYGEDGVMKIHRLHQEDFCQALGIVSEAKYQAEGGPSLRQCCDLLRKVSTSPATEIQAFFDAACFNFLVGNNDAHGKNFSLLYVHEGRSRQTHLAPLYDLVCTEIYPDLTRKMAMKIGGEYEPHAVGLPHFVKLASELGLSGPLAIQRVVHLATLMLEKLHQFEEKDLIHAIVEQVRGRCQALINESQRHRPTSTRNPQESE